MDQRQLKFRAWDKDEKKWREKEFAVGNEGQMMVPCCQNCDEWGESSSSDHYIIQQFTGLLDKNGKEIYEGDIVKYREDALYGGYEPNPLIHAVSWYEAGAGWMCGSDALGMCREPEVIGNIFENPEKLKA